MARSRGFSQPTSWVAHAAGVIMVLGSFALSSCSSSPNPSPVVIAPTSASSVEATGPRTIPTLVGTSVERTPVVTKTPEVTVPRAAPAWLNVTGNLANLASECGNLGMLSSVPSSSTVIASVARRGLWTLGPGGSWSQLPGSASISNRTSSIVFDPLNPLAFWESGTYNGPGVFRTTNGGSTFQQLGSITHNDFVSVDFSDPARQTLLAGGHEQSRTVWRSMNGGQTWTNVGTSLPGGTGYSSYPLVINSQTFVVGSDTGDIGIFRTVNGGGTWTKVSPLGPASAPLRTSDGSVYWVANGNLIKSVDGGETWRVVTGGSLNVTPVELPQQGIAIATAAGLYISLNGGTSWNQVGPTFSFVPQSLAYSADRKAFFISHWDCGDKVLPDAIMQLDWPVQ